MADASDDEPPVETKNKKRRHMRKFEVPDSLKDVYEEGMKKLKATKRVGRDPRFDFRVPGYCDPNDWEFVHDERQKAMQELQKELHRKDIDPEEHERTKRALKLLKQKAATADDFRLRKNVMDKLKEEQKTEVEAGRMPKFLKRSELRAKVTTERLKTKSKKQKESYISKQRKKGRDIQE